MFFFIFQLVLFCASSDQETFIDFINVGYDVRLDSSKGAPIFLYTFDEKKTFQFPERPDIGTIKVPDQLYVNNLIGHSENSVKSVYFEFMDYLSEYTDSRYFNLHINLIEFGLGIDYAHAVGKIRELMKSNTTMTTVSEIQYNLVKLQFIPPNLMEFDDFFGEFVKMLPTEIKTQKDIKILTEFITKYGTHYYSSGLFGGKIHLDSNLKKTYVYNKTVDYVMKMLDLDFRYKLFELAPGFFSNKSQIHIDSKFEKNVVTSSYFIGGNEEYQDLKFLDKWMASVILSPQLVSEIHVHPITELVMDNPQKQSTLANAISQYIKTGTVKKI